MRKDILKKRLTRLQARKADLKARAQASEDVAEVRAITAQIETLDEDIADVQEELDAIEAEERAAVPATAEVRGEAAVRASYGMKAATEERADDPFGTLEYRKAFMTFVQSGVVTPQLVTRDGAPASTQTLSATVPTTVMNEFINENRKEYGNLYAKVRKLAVKGGVKFPIADLSATFRWITESTVSPRQDGGEIKEYVEFSYNTAELRVAQTYLSSIVTLDLFEREIVRVMTRAYMKAMDEGIVRGTGNGQMLGILNDTRVTSQAGHIISMTAAQINDWTEWRKRFFAKLPIGYRGGEFIFALGTVDAYLETMADDNNNPIFRQATGLEVSDADGQTPYGRFFGREISVVEPDIIPAFDDASANDVIGIYWYPDEYAINENASLEMRRYFDEERNEWVNKMLTVVDGKVLNPRGYYLIAKA